MAWWIIWLLIGIVAFVGESATMALYLLYFGVAAMIVAGLAAVGVLPLLQLLAFVALSIGLLGVIRPRTLHLLGRQVPRGMLTNQGVRPDREGVVVEEIGTSRGMIRLGNAEFWTARVFQPGTRIAVGAVVRVAYVDGLTAYVEPLEVTAPESGPSVPMQPYVSRDEAAIHEAKP